MPESPDLPDGVGTHLSEPSADNRAAQDGVGLDRMAHLWSPWRFGYIADGPPIDGCPFCVLPDRGVDEDPASLILHRGEHAFVICNAYPYNPAHLMVVPFAHEADLADLDDATSAEVWELGRRCVAILRAEVGCEGVNIGMNLGTAGGAGIAEHLHLHVVPRWVGDTNFVTTVGSTRVLPRALDEVYANLRPAFDA